MEIIIWRPIKDYYLILNGSRPLTLCCLLLLQSLVPLAHLGHSQLLHLLRSQLVLALSFRRFSCLCQSCQPPQSLHSNPTPHTDLFLLQCSLHSRLLIQLSLEELTLAFSFRLLQRSLLLQLTVKIILEATTNRVVPRHLLLSSQSLNLRRLLQAPLERFTLRSLCRFLLLPLRLNLIHTSRTQFSFGTKPPTPHPPFSTTSISNSNSNPPNTLTCLLRSLAMASLLICGISELSFFLCAIRLERDWHSCVNQTRSGPTRPDPARIDLP